VVHPTVRVRLETVLGPPVAVEPLVAAEHVRISRKTKGA
jgi:hypothetical protein